MARLRPLGFSDHAKGLILSLAGGPDDMTAGRLGAATLGDADVREVVIAWGVDPAEVESALGSA